MSIRTIRFLGAAREVTGSCYLLTLPKRSILVDCGIVQGASDSRDRNREPFAFDPAGIDRLFLTHAHLDHSGLIPRLVKEGFRGRIVTTTATADLIGPMLLDSAKIQENDAERMSMRSLRKGGETVEPLYTTEDVEKVLPLIDRAKYGQVTDTGMGVRYCFLDAGHILGSGSLALWLDTTAGAKKIIFSGDIGRKGAPIINDPVLATEADYVVMESTYGNRLHKNSADTTRELAEAITTTFTKSGNVLIPAFAIGRTQDVLYLLNKLVREGTLPKLTVTIDSPLAEKATQIYLRHPELYDEEAKRLIAGNRIGDAIDIRFTHSAEESMALNKIKSGSIIIAGSGMCEGGRIRHHLKHNLWRPECSIIFVGFQAQGTLGRRIVDGAQEVTIWGEEIAVRARVWTIGGFSAHGDQKELLDWLSAFRSRPTVFVTHGEESAALTFADLVRKRYGFTTHVPEPGSQFAL
ncbi:MAG TPA: MBL fold metallo-hydrolase [Nitrospirota bacterium]|nr:MBL fold metallo-hydrolase [Nitrospirota bacterium]